MTWTVKITWVLLVMVCQALNQAFYRLFTVILLEHNLNQVEKGMTRYFEVLACCFQWSSRKTAKKRAHEILVSASNEEVHMVTSVKDHFWRNLDEGLLEDLCVPDMYSVVKWNPRQCKPTDWKKNMMVDVLIGSASSILSDEEDAPCCKPPTTTSVLTSSAAVSSSIVTAWSAAVLLMAVDSSWLLVMVVVGSRPSWGVVGAWSTDASDTATVPSSIAPTYATLLTDQ